MYLTTHSGVSGVLRTVQIKMTWNFVIMIFMRGRHRFGMFITCVGGKRLQLLVRAELGSHDTAFAQQDFISI